MEIKEQSRYFTIDPDFEEDDNLRRLNLLPSETNRHAHGFDEADVSDGFYSSDSSAVDEDSRHLDPDVAPKGP